MPRLIVEKIGWSPETRVAAGKGPGTTPRRPVPNVDRSIGVRLIAGRLVLLLRRVRERLESFVDEFPLLEFAAFGREPALDGCAGRAGDDSLLLPCSLAGLAFGPRLRRRRLRGRRGASDRFASAPSAAGDVSLPIIALGPRGGVF